MTQARSLKSPDIDFEGELPLEEEPDSLPMAWSNTQSSPQPEQSTNVEGISQTEVYPRVTVKLESPSRSPSRSFESAGHRSPATETSVVYPPNARPPRNIQLGPLSSYLARVMPATSWEVPADDQNPLYAFCHDPMMHINVMDTLVQYLQQHSFLASSMVHNMAVVPPSIYQMILCSAGRGSKHLNAVQAVWQHTALPTYVVLPVIDHGHWFVWRGAVSREGSDWKCDLRYLSSVGRPPQDILKLRASGVRAVVRALFPQLQRVHTWYHDVNGFKQAPGSSDCGLFVAQAVSAFIFEQPGALEALLPVARVKHRIFRILQTCAKGILEQILEGFIPEDVCLLHNHCSRGQRVELHPTNVEDIVYLLPGLVPLSHRGQLPQLQELQSLQLGSMSTGDTAGGSSDPLDSKEPEQHLPQGSPPSRSSGYTEAVLEMPRGRSLICTITFTCGGDSIC